MLRDINFFKKYVNILFLFELEKRFYIFVKITQNLESSINPCKKYMINFGCPEIYLENNINNEKRLHILLGHHSHPLKEEKMNYKVY